MSKPTAYTITTTITPTYTIRYSQKAKRLQMRMLREGLEIIVPAKRKPSVRIMESFIQENLLWIEDSWQRLQKIPSAAKPGLPTTLDLAAVSEVWTVRYLLLSRKTITLLENPNHELTVMGDISDEVRCLQKLRAWLQHKAKHSFLPQLTALSQANGLSFNQMTIRNNSTRWGSCSPEKNISLCCHLLFLLPHLVRHIMLHELCHTKALNHGRNFWRWLLKLDPNAKQHVKELKGVRVPLWVKYKVCD